MKLSDLLKFDTIVIQCHDIPDADAIGSGFALYSYFSDKGKNVRFIYSPTKAKRNSVDYNLTGNKSVFSRARRSELIDTSILNQMLEIPVKKKKKK